MQKIIFAFFAVTLTALSLLIILIEATTLINVTIAIVTFVAGVFSMWLSTQLD